MQANRETRLDEFDKDEWREVHRMFKPDDTDEQFEAAWSEFQEMKRRRSMQ